MIISDAWKQGMQLRIMQSLTILRKKLSWSISLGKSKYKSENLIDPSLYVGWVIGLQQLVHVNIMHYSNGAIVVWKAEGGSKQVVLLVYGLGVLQGNKG